MTEHIIGQGSTQESEVNVPIVKIDWNVRPQPRTFVGKATKEDMEVGHVHEAMEMQPVADQAGNVQIQGFPVVELHLDGAKDYIWSVLTDKSPFFQAYMQLKSGIVLSPANALPHKDFNPPRQRR